jgi:single-strand DNA-binding protein
VGSTDAHAHRGKAYSETKELLMASYNRVILVGNLTRDPELRYIASGTAVTDVGLAVNDRRKNANGEWVEETTFVDVTLWARTAEVFDTWETSDGQKRSKLRVVGERMQMLSSRGSGSGGRPPAQPDSQYSEPAPPQESPEPQAPARSPDDDIPF